MDENDITIIEALSDIILQKMKGLAFEQKEPSFDVDKSDDSIKLLTQQIYGLRKIRADFEILITAVHLN